jgi:hypothetical protein
MTRRGIILAVLCLALPAVGLTQASKASETEIIRKLLAEEAAARVDMPLGGEGIEVSERGEINESKLKKEIQKNGMSKSRKLRKPMINFLNSGNISLRFVANVFPCWFTSQRTPRGPNWTLKNRKRARRSRK